MTVEHPTDKAKLLFLVGYARQNNTLITYDSQGVNSVELTRGMLKVGTRVVRLQLN